MIFTFGFGQQCSCGRSLANCYTELDRTDVTTPYGVVICDESAVDRMYRLWGQNWSRAYATAEEAGVAEHGLKRIETNTDDPARCRCGAALTTQVEANG